MRRAFFALFAIALLGGMTATPALAQTETDSQLFLDPTTVPADFFASHGYAVVLQDVRGKFASEGDFHVYQGDRADWADTFDWVAAQPWSTGDVGTYGCSYLGEQQIVAGRANFHVSVTRAAAAQFRPVFHAGRERPLSDSLHAMPGGKPIARSTVQIG